MRIRKNFNLQKVIRGLDLTREINLMADSVVADHKKRGKYGIGLNGKKLKKLRPSTVHSKRAKGSSKPRTPLYDTGTMVDVSVVNRASRDSQKARIKPPKSRQDIGGYHQNGTRPYTIKPRNANALGPIYNNRGGTFFAREVRHTGVPKREWFGITKEQERKGLKRIARKIDMALR
tara:strand:- start:213 stop:740 length:528 start_codon:yes stop_codon:yes gene_type:complete